MFALALVFCLLVAKFFAGESAAAIIDVAVKALGIVIQSVLALMLLLFSVSFLSFTRSSRSDE